jgi:hypothetical protein
MIECTLCNSTSAIVVFKWVFSLVLYQLLTLICPFSIQMIMSIYVRNIRIINSDIEI